MFNNVVIDIFIGLIFIFLLYSFLATIVQEMIAHRLNLRARMLQKAIRKMLEDHVSVRGNWWQRSTFYNYFAGLWQDIDRFFRPFRDYEAFVKRFYDHPSVKYLGQDKAYSKPSYLQPHNFSYTVIQLLRGPNYNGSTSNEAELIKNALDYNTLNITPETLSHLRNLFADARQDVVQFKQRLEQWFDETMERTNGWYKRQTQVILITLGFLIAWWFNVDTIAITKILSRDKKVREQLVEMAISRKDQYASRIDSVTLQRKIPTSKKDPVTGRDTTIYDSTVYVLSDRFYDSTYRALNNDAKLSQSILGLEINIPDSAQLAQDKRLAAIDSALQSTTDNTKRKELRTTRASIDNAFYDRYHPYQKDPIYKLLGWLITAMAISLGAPFWFDLLNRFVQLRSSGTRVPTGTTGSGDIPVKTESGKTIRG